MGWAWVSHRRPGKLTRAPLTAAPILIGPPEAAPRGLARSEQARERVGRGPVLDALPSPLPGIAAPGPVPPADPPAAAAPAPARLAAAALPPGPSRGGGGEEGSARPLGLSRPVLRLAAGGALLPPGGPGGLAAARWNPGRPGRGRGRRARERPEGRGRAGRGRRAGSLRFPHGGAEAASAGGGARGGGVLRHEEGAPRYVGADGGMWEGRRGRS